MTSPSRRKHRTTRPSTSSPERSNDRAPRTSLGARGISILGALGIAVAVAVSSTPSTFAESPLDRLRNRSASERWDSIKPDFQAAPRGLDADWRADDEREPRRTTSGRAVPLPPLPSEWTGDVEDREIGAEPSTKRTTVGKTNSAKTPATAASTARLVGAERPERPRVALQPLVPQPSGGQPPSELPPAYPSPAELPSPGDEDSEYGNESRGFALESIEDILPYRDYEPNPTGDPCRNLCPYPEDCPPGVHSQCPDEYQLPEEGRDFADVRPQENIGFHWEASNLYSNPLYFDDPQLERYGHTLPFVVQPAASMARFGVQLIAIPYKATIDPYCKKMYALGFYRPGDCAPKQFEAIPFNRDAAVVQGAVTTGAIFLFP